MVSKDIWLSPPAPEKASKVRSILQLENFRFVAESDLYFLKKSMYQIRAFILLNCLLDCLLECESEINYYNQIIDELNIQEIVVITLKETWNKIEKKSFFNFKLRPTSIYFVEDENLHTHFSANRVTNRILSDLSGQFYLWPDLKYSFEKFNSIKMMDRDIPLFPYSVPNPDASPEALHAPLGEVLYHSPNLCPTEVSIIIPHYENLNNLRQNLINLIEESALNTELSIEVIIVDDGSTDFTTDWIKQFIQEFTLETSKLNLSLTALKLPREKKRRMGDCGFRAGMARNLGVEYSHSEILVFLDCDILISAEALKNIIMQHKNYDLIQLQRQQLKSDVLKTYHNINPKNDIDWGKTPYWDEFYKNAAEGGWDKIPHRWKYVSTYCLSIKKNTFLKLGQFSFSFVRYGCEDVDLGFRATEAQLKFHLLQNNVFHLQPNVDRSEYDFNMEKRRDLLLNAYFVLFQIHQKREIFESLVETQQLK